tara:strand:- start:56545 stop:56805 length:261 start_codon:yes stop_codon:yes gene_type:complete
MLVSRVKEKARPQTQMTLNRDAFVDRVGMMTTGLVSSAKLANTKTNLIKAAVSNVNHSKNSAHTRVPVHVLLVRMGLSAQMAKLVT